MEPIVKSEFPFFEGFALEIKVAYEAGVARVELVIHEGRPDKRVLAGRGKVLQLSRKQSNVP